MLKDIGTAGVAGLLALAVLAIVVTTGLALRPRDQLLTTCRQYNGDPMHVGLKAADAVYDSLPDSIKEKADRPAIRMIVDSMCQRGEDQTMQEIRDDLVQNEAQNNSGATTP